MNLELLESFGQTHPEDFDGTLDCVSFASCCEFNRWGSMLAVGCNDGRVVIWDFLTRGIAKIIQGHVQPISSISWSRSGRKILSSATDNLVTCHEVVTGECEHKFVFPLPVMRVQFNPRNSSQFIASPLKYAVVAVTLQGSHRPLAMDDDAQHCCASYDRRGKYILTGSTKGRVVVFDSTTCNIVASFKAGSSGPSNATIKQIEFARKGSCFLVSGADRIIRVYDLDEVLLCKNDVEPVQRLQDLVNKTAWKKLCFSGDGQFIVGGSARQHALYIWEKKSGTLVKILYGTRGELLLDVAWHPVRPIVASISSGVVSVWAQTQVENWSAFAPDFKELDENIEYDERESEFDLEDEDKDLDNDPDQIDEDLEVDVCTTVPVRALLSSDEENESNDALLFLPTAPEIDEPEETTWPADGAAADEEAITSSKKRKLSSNPDDSPTKRAKRLKTHEISLQLEDSKPETPSGGKKKGSKKKP